MKAAAVHTRTPSIMNRLTWIFLAVGLVCAPGILLLQRRACGVQNWPAINSAAIGVVLVISGVLGVCNGAIIATRHPENRIGWLCGITGVIGLFTALANRYALCNIYGDLHLQGFDLAVWASYVLAPLIIALVFWQIPFWFPHGNYLSRGWKIFAGASWAGCLVCLAVVSILPGDLTKNALILAYPVRNPLGVEDLAGTSLSQVTPPFLIILLLGVSAAANLSLVLRWRQAKDQERQQIKWFAYFAVLIVSVFLVIQLLGQFILPNLFDTPIYVIAFFLAWAGFPLVIGISVLKYRLYDIDVVIRRTLSYTVLSLLLASVYFISITVLQILFSDLSGQNSEFVIVLSTLLIAALFSPLRSWLQGAIDRRFYRSKYDAERTLEAFSANLRDEVELEPLVEHIEAVVDETMQPAATAIWLRKMKPPSLTLEQ